LSRRHRHINREFSNSYAELAAGIKLMTGGSQLSDYGTIGYANNYSLITINRIILTYLYTGNSIFQRAIQIPVQDAISKGVEIESGEVGNDEIKEILDDWDDYHCWDTILDTFTWGRLFGGGGVVINTEQDPEEKLDIDSLHNGKIAFYDADRWILTMTGSAFEDIENQYLDLGSSDYYFIYGQKIHRSRVMACRGKKAPAYIRRQLKGWGMSVAECLIRDLNNYLKTDDVLYEILDESKLDVYYIKDLASKLINPGGVQAVRQRVQTMNEIKNYLNAIVMDINDKYDQKTLNFAGLAEVKRENRIGIAGAVNMPVTKLFGISAAGFNSGEDDIENYNAMIESEIRTKIKPIVKKILKILFIRRYGYVPTFEIKFPSLRILSSVDEESVKASKTNRIIALYQAGILNHPQSIEMAKKENIITIDVDESAIPDKAEQPNGDQPQNPIPQIGIKRANAIKPNFNQMLLKG